jgi:Mg2+ and Co2+ transporter CorA
MGQNKNQVAKEPTEYTVREKAREESGKLFYDMYKHLTTLSTGSILILVAFLEKVFANPRWKILVALSFVFFLLTIIFSFFQMGLNANYIGRMGFDEATRKRSIRYAKICLVGFLSGILCLILFAIRNLFG